MNPELQRALAGLVEEMSRAAEAIGVQGVRLWPQLVGITFVRNLAWAVFIPAAWVVIGLVVRNTHASLHVWDAALPSGSDSKGLGPFFSGVIIGVWMFFVFVTFGAFVHHLSGVFYPEAATVIDLLARAGAAVKK